MSMPNKLKLTWTIAICSECWTAQCGVNLTATDGVWQRGEVNVLPPTHLNASGLVRGERCQQRTECCANVGANCDGVGLLEWDNAKPDKGCED